MASLLSILKKLDGAQRKLLQAAEGIPADRWKARPGEGRWSAAEVFAHVMMVESAVVANADRILKNQPKHVPFLRRFHLPFALVESRLIRRKTPIPVEPKLLAEKEVMLAELTRVRERTLALLEKNKDRDLSVYRWRHPFLGTIKLYGWFGFLASHQIRHEKQVREIARNLPKVIDGSQK